MADLIKFTDTLTRIMPWWLQRGLAGKIVFAIGKQFDAIADAAVQAVKRRFPSALWPDSLPLIGHDRKIRRGSAEADGVYASRLQRALDDHRTRGNPYAMLAQLHAYFATAPFLIELIYQSGRRYSMATDGTVTRDDIDYGDRNIAKWARWTLIYHWPTTINSFGKWGASGKKWGTGPTNLWGIDPSSLTGAQVRDLVLIPTDWNAAHCQGTIILLSPGRRVWGYPPRKWNTGNGKWGAGGKVVRLPVGI
jgi:hypothetical protein